MKTPATGSTLTLAALCVAALHCAAAGAFGFDDVARKAEEQAKRPYRVPIQEAPAELQALTYDEYRYIRFRPERSRWREEELPFELMFLHLGGKYATLPVRLNEITRDRVRYIPYDGDDFYLERNKLSPKKWGDIGFAGFRAHYNLNNNEYKDEVVAFAGASYFRALGAGQRYGMSARGLAIDTVGGGKGEEFPRFTEFWIVRPDADAKSLTVYALLDSPRASGAYQFDIRPGDDTVIDTRARVFLRAEVATLGLAPLTSMYFFGENQPHRTDFRPEVHDSDGLSVATGDGEWIWRPLLDPEHTLTTSFATRDPRGFGLMQRDRDFRSYEDGEARYELRPSVWVEPVGSWGPGRVELVQLNTPDETNDNIIAYWVPQQPPAPGQALDIAYKLHWQGAQQMLPPGGRVTQTRIGRGYTELAADEQQFVVDFTGPSLVSLPADAAVEAVVTAPSNGTIVDKHAFRLDATGAWRMTVRVKQLNPAEPTELRGFLQRGNDVLTETWSNILPARSSPTAVPSSGNANDVQPSRVARTDVTERGARSAASENDRHRPLDSIR